jgi:hypothetical protein
VGLDDEVASVTTLDVTGAVLETWTYSYIFVDGLLQNREIRLARTGSLLDQVLSEAYVYNADGTVRRIEGRVGSETANSPRPIVGRMR